MALRRDRRKRVFITLLTAQARQDPALTLRRPERVVQIRLQNRIGTDLDEYPVSCRGQRGSGLGKPDRVADIAPPVIGAEQPGGDWLGGYGRNQAVPRRLGQEA